jgi:predicted O-methyltransferase YrrM
VETGCIRDAHEGTDSTLVIASRLERGRLYTFELEPKHVEVCRSICRAYDARIEYVLGDSTASLRRLTADGTLSAIHFAFFDSANDADQIWAEFETVEDRFVPGSIVVVDDTVPPSRKGRRIKPYLHRHPAWETHLVLAGRGLLVAVRRDGSGA